MNKLRDKMAGEYLHNCSIDGTDVDIYDFCRGFDACAAIYEKREKMLVEAIIHDKECHYCNRKFSCDDERTIESALKKLKERK